MCGANQFCFDHGHQAVDIWIQCVPPNVSIYGLDFCTPRNSPPLDLPPVRSAIFIMPASMSRLHARSAAGDKPQYRNHSKLLAYDKPLAPSLNLDRMTGSVVHFQSTLRPPLGNVCNLRADSVIPNMSEAWSHIGKCDLTIPAQPLYRDPIPLPMAAAELQHTSPSTASHPGDIIAHPSVARALQTFHTELPKKITWADGVPAPHSPIVRPCKRSRTPFPVPEIDSQQNASRNDARSLSPKRLRTGLPLPSVDAPPFVTHSVFSGKGGLTNLQHLVRWLTGYLYFLISDPNCSCSRMTSLVDFPAQEAAMDKILDILVHYHPDNSIIFLALWYLVRLFPKPMVISQPEFGQDTTVELMSRVFLLGLDIASKWLNDFSMSLKDWSQFCSLPLLSVHELERSALKILNYNISISNTDWVSWLLDMRNSTSFYPPAYSDESVVAIVNNLLKTGPKVSSLYAHPKPIARPTPFELSSDLYSQVMGGLRAVPRFHQPISVLAICEPASWNPAKDPVVAPLTHGRTNGTAPGALPRATTAVDLLASILTNHSSG